MLTYDMECYSMKAVSTRWRLHAGCVLLTSDACLMVIVEPSCIVVWRLKDDDAVAYMQYMDNQHRADDLHYDDQHFCYVHDDNDVTDKQVRAAAVLVGNGTSQRNPVTMKTAFDSSFPPFVLTCTMGLD